MADIKISALPSSGPLTGTEEIPIVQAGGTFKTTAADIAGLSPSPTGTPNTFAYFDPSGNLASISSWSMQAAPYAGFSVANPTYQPNNLGNYPQAFYFNVQVDPLQSSPGDGLNVLSVNANLDSSANGFDFGTNGQAVSLVQGGFNYGGNGSSYGGLAYLSFNSSIGDGTNPVSIKGLTYGQGFFNLNANATIDGQLQGWGFQAFVDSAAIGTSNFNVNAFYDFANIGVAVHGYNSLIANPNIAEISNNSNYGGISVSPNIPLFSGNAGFTGVGVYGTYTTLGTGGWQGINMNPTIGTQQANSGISFFGASANITTMGASASLNGFSFNPNVTTAHGNINGISINPHLIGGDADVNLIQGNMNQVTGTSTNLSVLNLSGQTADGKESSANINGVRFNVSGTLTAASGQNVQSQHVIFTQYQTPNSTAITGTDVLMNILSPDVNFGNSTSSVAIGPSGLGNAMVVFGGQCHGHGQMDRLAGLISGGIFMDDFTLGEWRGVQSLMINAGYSGTCTDATGFYHEVAGAGLFATNHWGVKIASDIDNSMYKLALNTSTKKVSSANVKLEVGEGHIKTSQAVKPTIAADANAGTGATVDINRATDSSGLITIQMGTGSFAPGAQLTVTFDKPYGNQPIVLIAPANAAAADSSQTHQISIGTINTTDFSVNFGVQENNASTVYSWYYWVIESEA